MPDSFQHHLNTLDYQEGEIAGFVCFLWRLNFEGKIGVLFFICVSVKAPPSM